MERLTKEVQFFDSYSQFGDIFKMKSVYLTSNGDTTIDLPIPLEVEGYGVGVVEMSGRV